MANEDWMGGLNNNRKLNTMVIPGSHDASLYRVKRGGGYSRWFVDASVTQFNNFTQQLADGARYFDVRVYKDTAGNLRGGHFQKKNKAKEGRGAFGPKFSHLVDQTEDFLDNHVGETVIWKISLADDAKDDALAAILQGFGDKLLRLSHKYNIADLKLGRCRGKLIATFDKAMGTNIHQQRRLHLCVKKTPKTSKAAADLAGRDRSVLYLNGDAPQKDTIKSVVDTQNSDRKGKKGTTLAPHLEMVYLTITAGVMTAIGAGGFSLSGSKAKMCIADNTAREIGLTGVARTPVGNIQCKYTHWAPGAGVRYQHYLNKMKYVQQHPINLIQYDFVNEEVNNMIIARN